MMAKKPEFVVVPFDQRSDGFAISDHEGIDDFSDEKSARARVDYDLKTGSEVVGLYRLIGLYRVKKIDLEDLK